MEGQCFLIFIDIRSFQRLFNESANVTSPVQPNQSDKTNPTRLI